MRLVLDTNIVVAGLRSPAGASAALLGRALDRRFTLVLTVPLALEYEAKGSEPAQCAAAGLDAEEVRVVVTALCAVADPVESRYLWRPQLRDPADEMVLEAAINGRAEALVTFNRRDFAGAPERFGIALLSPQDALRSVRP